ncbi:MULTISPECIES: DMT family transporter [unclassified Roseitalea]|uniref:DMT family transporter n=1 Tax=unclassified Roseitalea TaxID=2639107 RepID=UPI00273E6BE6|nr:MULTISPECIES: DMT family transporter [unclassified Roseitalea]
MTQWALILAAFATGALVPLQLVFNGQLGGVTRNAFTASLIVFLIGALVLAAMVVITRPTLPSVGTLMAAPKTVWLGGLIATAYIVAIVIITPRLGVGVTTGLILVGQLCMALALDHFGAFGNPQQTLGLGRAAGLSLMVAGVVLIKSF